MVETYKFPSVFRESKFIEEGKAIEYLGEKWIVGKDA